MKDLQNQTKQEQILDALQALLENKNIQNISVSEIAQTAGIGKGSIYYYFPSKDSIVDALVERNYEKPLETAKNLSRQTDISPFTRMAMIFQACRNSTSAFRAQKGTALPDAKEDAFIRQKYMKHLISEMKPVLAEIIRQGIDMGQIRFDYPAALAEIALIVLTVKLNDSDSSGPEESEETIRGLISLLEKGTENPAGSLNFLMS